MKKNILIYLKNGAAELDWVLPVLYQLKKKNNIYFILGINQHFENLKRNNELFILWEKIYRKYYINKFYDRFIFKFIRKIIYKLLPLISLEKYLEYFDNKINSLEYLENKFNTHFSMIMCEFDFKNKLLDNFKKKFIHSQIS